MHNVDELGQEDFRIDGNTFYNPFHTLVLEDTESSSTFQDPSNMHEFHQQQQVIGDLSKPVMTRRRLYTDAKMCMHALRMSTMEPKNLKEAMLDHNWIEPMQDKLDQFKRLDVWKLVKRLVGRNIITVKWL
ncbi:hypothetical protein Tco_0999251 [Tanacetum coccineum]